MCGANPGIWLVQELWFENQCNIGIANQTIIVKMYKTVLITKHEQTIFYNLLTQS